MPGSLCRYSFPGQSTRGKTKARNDRCRYSRFPYEDNDHYSVYRARTSTTRSRDIFLRRYRASRSVSRTSWLGSRANSTNSRWQYRTRKKHESCISNKECPPCYPLLVSLNSQLSHCNWTCVSNTLAVETVELLFLYRSITKNLHRS